MGSLIIKLLTHHAGGYQILHPCLRCSMIIWTPVIKWTPWRHLSLSLFLAHGSFFFPEPMRFLNAIMLTSSQNGNERCIQIHVLIFISSIIALACCIFIAWIPLWRRNWDHDHDLTGVNLDLGSCYRWYGGISLRLSWWLSVGFTRGPMVAKCGTGTLTY